jgi:hypothetical protein
VYSLVREDFALDVHYELAAFLIVEIVPGILKSSLLVIDAGREPCKMREGGVAKVVTKKPQDLFV